MWLLFIKWLIITKYIQKEYKIQTKLQIHIWKLIQIRLKEPIYQVHNLFPLEPPCLTHQQQVHLAICAGQSWYQDHIWGPQSGPDSPCCCLCSFGARTLSCSWKHIDKRLSLLRLPPGPAVAAPGAVTPQLLGADHPHGAGCGLGNGNTAPPGY